MTNTYLKKFITQLESSWKGSLFTVKDAERVNKRAKEYLHRLEETGEAEKVRWGWYYLPSEIKDVWDFLTKDQSFKVVIKQTASSIWNYDFVHRDVYRLAVDSFPYKKALEEFARKRGWIFEVECYENLRKKIDYKEVDGLFVEKPESCIVNCTVDWSFLDALSVLFFRKEEIPLERVRELGRWKRISKTDVRAWNAIKYSCNLFNEYLNERIFDVKSTRLTREDVKELVEEAVEKVVKFA